MNISDAQRKKQQKEVAHEQKAIFDLLIQAIQSGDKELFYSCLHGDEGLAHCKSSDGKQPLLVACEFSQLEIVKCLIEQSNCDVNSVCLLTNYTPVMFAAQNADQDMMEYLIEKGADLQHVSVCGRNAFKILSDSRLNPVVAEWL